MGLEAKKARQIRGCFLKILLPLVQISDTPVVLRGSKCLWQVFTPAVVVLNVSNNPLREKNKRRKNTHTILSGLSQDFGRFLFMCFSPIRMNPDEHDFTNHSVQGQSHTHLFVFVGFFIPLYCIGGSQKGGFQKGGFGGCSPGTKTGTRVRSPKPPFWKPPFYLPVTLFGVDKRVVSKRVVSADVPPERKPERGYVRQNHPFTKPPFYLPVIVDDTMTEFIRFTPEVCVCNGHRLQIKGQAVSGTRDSLPISPEICL